MAWMLANSLIWRELHQGVENAHRKRLHAKRVSIWMQADVCWKITVLHRNKATYGYSHQAQHFKHGHFYRINTHARTHTLLLLSCDIPSVPQPWSSDIKAILITRMIHYSLLLAALQIKLCVSVYIKDTFGRLTEKTVWYRVDRWQKWDGNSCWGIFFVIFVRYPS